MEQSGNTINNESLQEFLDSAANAAEYGQRQFFTPRNLAEAFCRPLPAARSGLVLDLHFGSGALAFASGAKTALGIDIDARSAKDTKPPQDSTWKVEQADLTQWYPLAAESGFTAPFILINPPFSLRWYSDRLGHLRSSALPEVVETFNAHPKHIDSTLASFLIALDLLSANGEGFMVCNAATARRFFGDPGKNDRSAPHSSLRKYIWMWLEVPGAVYENQHTAFDTAVLYFSRTHGRYSDGDPLFLTSAAAAPEAVLSTLFTPEVFHAHRGTRIRYDHETQAQATLSTFRTVNDEYRCRFRGKRPDWNIRLDEKGNIRTYLTPFQKVSKRLDRNLVAKLHALDGHSPIQLCVTATSRTALREAAQCAVWRIQPEVHEAIANALLDYDKDGAPFYRPSVTQSLGWIDEHGELTCLAPGIGSCMPGDRCPISSSIEKTTWKGKKINLAGKSEDLEYKGEELLVVMSDPDGVKHHFHVRRDETTHADVIDEKTKKIVIQHHTLASLIEHFDIPVPKDITALRPDDYQANLTRLAEIEQMVSKNLAKAAAA